MIYRLLSYAAVAALTFSITTVYDRHRYLRAQQALLAAHEQLRQEHRALKQEIRANLNSLLIKMGVQR